MDKSKFSLLAVSDASGPVVVRVVDSLSRARELCFALLWLADQDYSSVSICDRNGVGLACFRRFPPGRQKAQSESLVGVEYEIRHGMGARLSSSASGGKRKAF